MRIINAISFQQRAKRVFQNKMGDKKNTKKNAEKRLKDDVVSKQRKTLFFEYLLYKNNLKKKIINFVYNLLTSFIQENLPKLVDAAWRVVPLVVPLSRFSGLMFPVRRRPPNTAPTPQLTPPPFASALALLELNMQQNRV